MFNENFPYEQHCDYSEDFSDFHEEEYNRNGWEHRVDLETYSPQDYLYEDNQWDQPQHEEPSKSLEALLKGYIQSSSIVLQNQANSLRLLEVQVDSIRNELENQIIEEQAHATTTKEESEEIAWTYDAPVALMHVEVPEIQLHLHEDSPLLRVCDEKEKVQDKAVLNIHCPDPINVAKATLARRGSRSSAVKSWDALKRKLPIRINSFKIWQNLRHRKKRLKSHSRELFYL